MLPHVFHGWYLGQQEQSGKHFDPFKNRHKAHLQRTGMDFWPYIASNGSSSHGFGVAFAMLVGVPH